MFLTDLSAAVVERPQTVLAMICRLTKSIGLTNILLISCRDWVLPVHCLIGSRSELTIRAHGLNGSNRGYEPKVRNMRQAMYATSLLESSSSQAVVIYLRYVASSSRPRLLLTPPLRSYYNFPFRILFSPVLLVSVVWSSHYAWLFWWVVARSHASYSARYACVVKIFSDSRSIRHIDNPRLNNIGYKTQNFPSDLHSAAISLFWLNCSHLPSSSLRFSTISLPIFNLLALVPRCQPCSVDWLPVVFSFRDSCVQSLGVVCIEMWAIFGTIAVLKYSMARWDLSTLSWVKIFKWFYKKKKKSRCWLTRDLVLAVFNGAERRGIVPCIFPDHRVWCLRFTRSPVGRKYLNSVVRVRSCFSIPR